MVRDAFINGITSSSIRQRLLENCELKRDAVTQANTRELAQQNSLAYDVPDNLTRHVAAVTEKDQLVSKSQLEEEEESQLASVQPRKFKEKKCFFCGTSFHDRSFCPARSAVCYNCKKKGHFARVCKSRQSTSPGVSAMVPTKQLCATQLAPSCLPHATVTSNINGHELSTVIDTGSSLSFINKETLKTIGLRMTREGQDVTMATTDLHCSVMGSCITNLSIGNKTYNQVKLKVLENLCSDLLLGSDFQQMHEKVIFRYDGSKVELVPKPDAGICSTVASRVKPVSLFSNLLPGCYPIATKSRKHNTFDYSFIEKEVERLRNDDIIRPSNSPWRAQVLVIRNEETQKPRMCIDYSQTINLFTLLDAYPLPKIDSVIHQLAKYRQFSTFDLRNAYHQIPICESDKQYTAFEAAGKLWEFNRVPFGVTNGVPVFQRLIDDVVEKDSLKDTFPYLDNVTIGGFSKEQHDKNVERFLESLKKRNLLLNHKKTISSVDEISILGYCVGNGCIKPDPDRLRPLLDLPVPHNAKSLKRALGLFAYYAKWIANFPEKIKNLKNTKIFPMDERSVTEFESLKKEIAGASLSAIDETLPFIVECDASETAVSATLNQGGRPVAFTSRTLQPSERHYPAVEKEATLLKPLGSGGTFWPDNTSILLRTSNQWPSCSIAGKEPR